MTSAAIVGSTGLVGSHILNILLSLRSISSVHALARREPPATDAKLHAIISKDSSEWPSILSSITPTPSIFFSGLGTTRATAGSVDNQRKIDYDLNLALARAVKESGVKVYVLISAQAASATSSLALPKMKGELEDSIMALEFEHTVILRPGLILGAREESRPVEAAARMIAGFVGLLGDVFKDPWAQNADVIGRAAIKSGLQALEGKAEKVWIVRQSDIVKLGRTE